MTTKLAHLLRRTSLALVVTGLVLAAAGPASAATSDVPEFWSDPDPVDPMHTVLVFVVLPLAIILVISLLVVVPGIVKGERFTPGGQATADQWFGGPAQGTAELPAADTEESKAGGASGRW